jgi:hypothetical protein
VSDATGSDEERPARPARAPRTGGAPKRSAGGARSGAPKREYTPRGDASASPKREYKPRDGAAPKREYKPRDGAAPKREYKPRDGAAPKREYKPRDGAAPKREYKPRDGAAPKREWKGTDDRAPKREWDARDDRPPRALPPRFDDPLLPDTIKGDQLDRIARNELKTLSTENQEFVARHLVMAANLIGDDPQTAHKHALAASRRGGRIGMVRESLAITAYATGDFALALRELRTYRRITGRDDQLPMMVDSERGLGRPDRALEVGRSVKRDELPVPVQVELAIAMSGARLDLGQTDRALAELEIPQLDHTTAFSWSAGLFDAYATVLEELGRAEDAERWYGYADTATAALFEASDDDELIEIEDLDDISGLEVDDTGEFAGETKE